MKKRVLGLMLLGMGMCFSSQAASATWDGGHTNGIWTAATNWVGDTVPTFNNTLDVYFNTAGAANLTNWIGNNTAIRSLNFNDDADGDIRLSFNNNGSIGARTLTIGGAGGATISSTAGAAGNFNVGQGNGTSLTLAENLLVDHNGSGTLTISKNITGAYSITNKGSGTVSLTASNSFTGGITANAGTLNVTVANGLGTGDLTINNGGTVALSANVGPTNKIVNDGTMKVGGNNVIASQISGNGAIYHNSSGAFTMTLTGDNSGFSGVITNAGTMKFANAQSLGNSTIVLGDGINTGTMGLNSGTATGANAVANSIVLNGNGNVIGNNQGPLELSGVISGGANGLAKGGGSKLILSGTNTYTGATTVNDGTLIVNGVLASSLVTVSNGSTFGGSGKVEAVTLDAGAILAVGNSPGTMTFGGDVILSDGSTNMMEITDIAYDILMGDGANTLTVSGVTIFDFTGFTGGVTNGYTLSWSDMFQNWGTTNVTGTATYSALGLGAGQSLDITPDGVTVIPEPATIGMLGLGALITLLIRRMRAY